MISNSHPHNQSQSNAVLDSARGRSGEMSSTTQVLMKEQQPDSQMKKKWVV
jgi:hypothetical protein